MNIDFEKLEQLDEINKKVNEILKVITPHKRWMSTKELSYYIPYSIETINKKVQNGELKHGVHFYQQQKTRVFDKQKIDEWIMKKDQSKEKTFFKNEILERMTLDLK